MTAAEATGATGAPREELVERVLDLFHQMGHALRPVGDPEWRDLDLTMSQLKTLLSLVHRGPMAVGEVAAALGVGAPNASHLVDQLVHLGLATRHEDPADRRRTLVGVTAVGEELVDHLFEGRRRRLRLVVSAMDGPDADALERGLRALLAADQRHPIDTDPSPDDALEAR